MAKKSKKPSKSDDEKRVEKRAKDKWDAMVKRRIEGSKQKKMYTVEGLKHGIERCKVNIDNLAAAIVKEKETIKEYQFMIDGIAKADSDMAEAKAEEKRLNGLLNGIQE